MDFSQSKGVKLEQIMPLMKEQLSLGNTVSFYPKGTSMLPMLRQNKDSVILAPISGSLRKYDLPLYQRDNGQYVLHRIVGVGETYTCMGDNQLVPEEGVRPDQMIAVVTAFTRDGKKVSVDNPAYRLYCRVWVWLYPLRQLWVRGKGFLRRELKKLLGRMPR